MADLNKIVDELSKLTVVEAAELSKTLEEKWGVTAAAPVAAAAPAQAAEAAADKDEFSVVLASSGSNKIGASLLVKKIINEVSTNKNNANNKLLEYFSKNSISYLTKEDWKKIDQIEIESANANFTRNKLVDIESINNKLKV